MRRLAPRSRSAARLFCFPYAGGGAAAFRLWTAGLPAELDIWAAQLPGRANRLHEPVVNSVPNLVDALVEELMPRLDLPFAFFGHSMGSVLASEVARAVVSRGGPAPRHLIVSGRRPPGMSGPESRIHMLPDDEFIAEINRRYGGIPTQLLRDRELLMLLLPGLRADVTAVETFQPGPREPLDCPISAFGGTHDRLTPRAQLDAWRGQTTGPFRVRVFPGDHFYLDARRAEILADLSMILAPMLRRSRALEVTA